MQAELSNGDQKCQSVMQIGIIQSIFNRYSLELFKTFIDAKRFA